MHLSAFSVILCSSLLAAGEVVTWPAVEVRTCAPLAVKVNGTPVEVMTLPAPTHCLKGENAHPYHAAFFDADCEVEVEVVGGDAPMRDVRILPLAKGVKPQVTGERTMRFRATPPFTLAVEPQGRHGALIVSANVPERDAPKPDDPNVVYIGPGRHHRDTPLRIGSNQTLYLAPGAYLESAVAAHGTNITVRGRGIISGAPWAWCKGPAGHMVSLKGRDVTIRDVTLMSAYTWCLVLDGCEHACVDNVKILNGRVLNDDGIDVCQSRDVTIRNCFIRTQDDCITPKWWCEDLLVENCALWTDVANIFRIGYECAGKDRRYRNLTFRGIDVLHQSIHKTISQEYWAENTIFIQPANDQPFENFTFEDIRFDTVEAGDLFLTVRTFLVNDTWQHHKVAGHFRNLVVRDVHFPAAMPPNTMGVRLESHDPAHGVADVAFENVTGCGPLIVAGDVKGVKIPESSFARPTPVTAWKLSKPEDWTVSGDTLTSKGASWACAEADLPVATGGVFTARVTATQAPAKPSDGMTCGLRFRGPDGYWGLSLWRQVGANGSEGARRFEFEECLKDRRCAHLGKLVPLYRRGGDRGWNFGETYLFTLKITPTAVEAVVFDDRSGKELFAEKWAIMGRPAVVVGRPTLYSWNGVAATFADVAWQR